MFKRYPFTIILKCAVEHPEVHPLRLKIDPGSQTTGIALVDDRSGDVVWAAELTHRGPAIKHALDQRRAVRRGQQATQNPLPHASFPESQTPSRVAAPVAGKPGGECAHLGEAARVASVRWEPSAWNWSSSTCNGWSSQRSAARQYQQGTLLGYEVREYLLEKWDRACSYCGINGVPLQVEHLQAKANGGTDRVSNLCLACEPCNQAKGTQDIRVFLADKPDRLARILAQAKTPLKDAAAVNSTRWALY